jgi:hypothetical protein
MKNFQSKEIKQKKPIVLDLLETCYFNTNILLFLIKF